MLLALSLLACNRPCEGDRACSLENGEYHVLVPDGWDEQEPLPVVVHFHGYRGSAEQYYANDDIVDSFSEAGVLAILPNGIDGRWNSNPAWTEPGERDDFAFVAAVLDDVAARLPLDKDRVYATGFSAGSAMAVRLACTESERFAAIAPISGGFWDPAPTDCSMAPIPVSHTHGTSDETWPLEGRCFRPGDGGGCDGGQAPMVDNFALWTEHLSCGADASTTMEEGPLSCEVWTDCASGLELRRCLHDGGHERLDGWPARQSSWLLQHSR